MCAGVRVCVCAAGEKVEIIKNCHINDECAHRHVHVIFKQKLNERNAAAFAY